MLENIEEAFDTRISLESVFKTLQHRVNSAWEQVRRGRRRKKKKKEFKTQIFGWQLHQQWLAPERAGHCLQGADITILTPSHGLRSLDWSWSAVRSLTLFSVHIIKFIA